MNEADKAQLQDLRQALRMLSRIDPWIETVTVGDTQRPWTAADRSPLSVDDDRTHPYRLSHRSWLAITVAVDFLHCLRRSLTQESNNKEIHVQLHTYAQMALLRGAVENACCAVYLLGPPMRLKRVTNRLKLEWKEIKPAHRLRELAGAPPAETIEQRQQKLADILIAAKLPYAPQHGEDPQVAARRVASKTLKSDLDYAQMIRCAGELVPELNADVAEATWRMCSGLAHGDFSASIGVLDTEVVEQLQPGIKLVRASVSVKACSTLRRSHSASPPTPSDCSSSGAPLHTDRTPGRLTAGLAGTERTRHITRQSAGLIILCDILSVIPLSGIPRGRSPACKRPTRACIWRVRPGRTRALLTRTPTTAARASPTQHSRRQEGSGTLGLLLNRLYSVGLTRIAVAGRHRRRRLVSAVRQWQARPVPERPGRTGAPT